MKRGIAATALALFLVALAGAGEVGFIEDFALSKNRAAALQQLIPGTEDYYYFHCLHFLNSEQFEKVETMTKPWLERFGQTPRLTEIQTRGALLAYERNPQKTLDYLKNRLNLRFDHQQAEVGVAPNLPTSLDPKVIARDTLRGISFARWQNLDNFEDAAFGWLASDTLNVERRRNLLQRLQRPDVPNLPKLVADDLASVNAPDFGAYVIHRQMTQAQLEELVRLRPILLNHAAFVQTMLTKLRPGADDDWRHEPNLTKAYLDRLLAFVRRLDPVHNPLKAHVLHQRLVFDRTQDTHDRALFMEYLKLPRQQHYMAQKLIESVEARQHPADLNANYEPVTMLPIVGGDEALVRDYLKRFLLTMDSPKEFEPYINDVYLRHLFAETKVEAGLGEPDQWAAQLPPELFRQLKDRIDIDFAPTNKTNFGADEPVRLDVHVKNVPTLLVKVFEINAQNFYREHLREVNTDINLDGLVANAEQIHPYSESSFRRVLRHLEFPQLNKPGVYVIDFIGSGKSSRALIRKGKLHPIVATGTAGQTINVVDDMNRLVKGVTLWLGGQEYKSDADGSILVPFSTAPGRHPIVLSRGEFSCLEYLNHQPEGYQLKAGIHVDREALLSQRIAQLLIRPGLYLNGIPVSVGLLEDVRLKLTATDLDNIATTAEVPNFKLFQDRESIHDFRVPPRLASLRIELHAKVKSLTENKQIDVATGDTFSLNGIDKTDKIEDLHLAKFGSDWVIDLLGRTSEARGNRPVQLAFKHREFREPVHVTLKTDAHGRVHLGPLPDIMNVSATGPEGTAQNWPLPSDQHTYRRTIHAKAGETVTLPYVGVAAAPSRDELALFALRADVIQADLFDQLAIRDGMIEIRNIAAGDYELWLKRSGEHIRIRVADGAIVGNYVLSNLRQLQLPLLKPVQIASVVPSGDVVTVSLKDASPFTRVHVFATRYHPEYSAFRDLGSVRDAELQGMLPAHAESTYLIGRNIGDEYRYVLDRKNQKKFPGNMMDRPALLLNPWAVRSTETGEQLAHGGEDFGRRAEPGQSAGFGAAKGDASAAARAPLQGVSPDLDFLADATSVLANLVPDKEGIVKFTRKEISPHAMIQVVAVDPLNVTTRSVTLPEQPAKFLDLRLASGLDPREHFTQQKQVSLLTPNQVFNLPDVTSSRFEAYDSLAKVYGLYTTLTHDAKLAEFSFILNWPKLKQEEKQTLYSKYACHELSFFLAKKDPDFFRTVIRPYLANKKDKTFLDRWLLEEEVSEYALPWRFERLNMVERILLAQRLPNEPAKTARHLTDLFRLLPPNPDRTRLLFETAVKSSALDVHDPMPAKKPAPEFRGAGQADDKPREAPATAPPSPSAGGMGGGGGRGGAGYYPGRPGGPGGPESGKSGAGAERDKDGLRRNGRMLEVEEKAKDLKKQFKEAGAERLEDKVELELLGVDRARKSVQQLYRKVDVTQEWAENNYFKLLIHQQLADLVSVNPFWVDYAKHDGKAAFLSQHLADASRNFTEMMFALAVLDLPFSAGKHDLKFTDSKLAFTPAGPAIAFHEQVRPVAGITTKPQILVSQSFYKHGDRFREEAGEKIDKFITDEFVVHTVYGCQVVVTNATSSRQRLSVLVQTPVGSIPVANSQFTKTLLLDLEPYRTQTIDYLFYFPLPGKFAHFPVHVAKNESLVVSAQPFEFNVVPKATKIDTDSWAFISQQGTNDQVLALLGRENVNALNLELIAFRMRDKAFFEAVLAVLQERHVYQPTLWSYALYHNAVPAARQYLLHVDQIVGECGGPIASTLLTVDPVARYQYEHLEYKPLVNARAHPLGERRQIVNPRLHEQYHRFLKLLSYRTQLGDDDELAVTYYLLLQDRIEEALAAFNQVNADKVATKMQYDYCAAYLDLFGDDPIKARAIAMPYTKHPVDRWRNAFTAIVNCLNEMEGKGGKLIDAENRDQRQGEFAAKEPAFDFTLDAKAINLTYQNIDTVRVNFYLMDVELLFSRNPFVQQGGSQFASIRPNATQVVTLPGGQTKHAVPLPENLLRRNVLVEVTGAGKTRALPYYANAMTVRLTENYGQVHVTDAASGKALPKVYVKTYVRLADGQVKFYKDGYTDQRGRFDYASVSTPERLPPSRFAILVLSEDRGAQIREAAPPQQ